MIIQHYPDELDYVRAKLHSPEHKQLYVDFLASFLTTFCEACLRADTENYELLRPVLHALMKKYPQKPAGSTGL